MEKTKSATESVYKIARDISEYLRTTECPKNAKKWLLLEDDDGDVHTPPRTLQELVIAKLIIIARNRYAFSAIFTCFLMQHAFNRHEIYKVESPLTTL